MSIEDKIRGLPPELQHEVEEFVDLLLERHRPVAGRKLRLDWRGALRDMRDRYTSVELQHKALEWWGD